MGTLFLTSTALAVVLSLKTRLMFLGLAILCVGVAFLLELVEEYE